MHPTFATAANLDLLEDFYRRWRENSSSVDERWQAFFEGFELAGSSGGTSDTSQTGVVRMVYVYRNAGHLRAHLDPLSDPPGPHPMLELSQFGLRDADLDRKFDCSVFRGLGAGTLRELIAAPRRNVLPHHRRRVHAHPGHAHPPLVAGTHGAAAQSARTSPASTEDPHSEEPALRRAVRAFPAHPLHRPETVLARRGRNADPDSRSDRRERRPTYARPARSSSAWPTAAGSTCWRTFSASPTRRSSPQFEDNFLPDSMDGDGDVKYHLGFSSDRVNDAPGKRSTSR